MGEQMSEFKHWCGNCQIRVYIQRHYGNLLSWQDCPYTCEYATAMRCSIKPHDRAIDDYEYGNYCPNCGADMREQP